MKESPLRQVRQYDTVEELLEANNEFKNNMLSINKDRLQRLKDGYNIVKNDPKVDSEKLGKLRESIERFEKFIDFYENRSW